MLSRRASLLTRFGSVVVLIAASLLTVPTTTAGAAVTFGGPWRVHAGATNWAGNVARGHTYTDARANWVVPAAAKPSGGAVLHWVGIGQGASSTRPLVQAGTATDVGGHSYVWIETFPLNAVTPVGYFGTVDNHLIGVHIHFASSTSVSIHLHDSTDGRDYTCTPTSSTSVCRVKTTSGMAPDGTAEWITESVGSKPVAEFGAVNFHVVQGYYSASVGWKGVGLLSHTAAVMYNARNQIKVAPYYIGTDNQSFTNYWYRAT